MTKRRKILTPLFSIFLLPIFLILFPKSVEAASLVLSPATESLDLDQTFTVEVVLDTAGSNSDSADVILKYDADKLSVVSSVLGALYDNKARNDTGVSGKITLRAYSSPGTFYNGQGTLATITFKAKAVGTAIVYFDFIANSTTDCNVSLSKTDILTSVTGATYTIAAVPPTPTAGAGSAPSLAPTRSPAAPTRPPAATATSTPAATRSAVLTATPWPTLPTMGVFEVTLGIGLLGLLLLAAGSVIVLL